MREICTQYITVFTACTISTNTYKHAKQSTDVYKVTLEYNLTFPSPPFPSPPPTKSTQQTGKMAIIEIKIQTAVQSFVS